VSFIAFFLQSVNSTIIGPLIKLYAEIDLFYLRAERRKREKERQEMVRFIQSMR
jgi:hypothetical protein